MVERALVRLREMVRDQDLKNSRVREAIAREAVSYPGHFTVEELLRVVRASGAENAHLATIYRTIPLLIEAGLIEEALVGSSESQVYERSFEREHHDHLICTSCRKIVEFYSEPLEAIQREIATRYGYRLDGHVHELWGLCADCQRLDAAN